LRRSRKPEPHYHKGKKRCGEKSLPQGGAENREGIGGEQREKQKIHPREKKEMNAYLLYS